MNAMLNNKHSVLVVDDQPQNIDLLVSVLSSDYKVIVANSGEKALQRVMSEMQPDLILLDIMMPVMDGFEVIEKIKQSEKAKDIPVLFLTAKTSAEDETKGLELGAIDYIIKPLNIVAVKAKVKTHLELVQKRKFVDSLVKDQLHLIQKTRDNHNVYSIEKEQVIKENIHTIQQNEERLRLALWASKNELWDWDIESGIVHRTGNFDIPELPLHLIIANAENCAQHLHHKDRHKFIQCLQQHLQGKTDTFELEYRVRDYSGEWRWFHDIGKVTSRDDQGRPLRMLGTLKDVNKRRLSEERARIIARSFSTSSDGVWIADHNFNIIIINDAYTSITGFTATDVVGKAFEYKDHKISSQQMKMCLSRDDCWSAEMKVLRKDGHEYIQELKIDAIKDDDEDITHYLGVLSDITLRKKSENELRRLANYDSLTGLPNRALFRERIERIIELDQNIGASFGLLFIDLDNFKNINDSLGHDAGDQLLIEVAKRLIDCRRPNDTVSRLGGDEFTFIVEGLSSSSHVAAKVAERVVNAFKMPFKLLGKDLEVTCSIGIAVYPCDGQIATELIKNADAAMYVAKSNGKNHYHFFTTEMKDKALFRLNMETELRQAIKDEVIELHYQSKVDLSTGHFRGMECLCRWNNDGEYISPEVFIPIAEETALILPLGELVLRIACRQGKIWLDKGLLNGRMAVNLSARQFLQSDLLFRIDQILEEAGFPAECLELEITEGTVMEDTDRAIDIMHALQRRNISLSIDDFGTGYSSLNYLKQFPISFLKIDKTFVTDMLKSEKGMNLVSSIINMAHCLDLKIVAEGVETREEADALADLHAEEVQGFLFSKPIGAKEFEHLLYTQQNLLEKPGFG